MLERKKRKKYNGMSRREFLKKTGIAVTSLGTAAMVPSLARKIFAAERDYILIGHPTPVSGPLAAFGAPSKWITNLIMGEINKDGGIYLNELGKKLPVKVKSMDCESNPNKAAELASKLILMEKVDLIVVAHTPDTVNPVSGVCERYGTPCISSVAPIESWLAGGPYKWTFHFFWNFDNYTKVFSGMWKEHAAQTNKVVGGFWPNDPDGVSAAKLFGGDLKDMGYKVVDVGRFPYGVKDYSSFITTWKKEKVEILTGSPISPDFASLWRQCHQQGFIPKIATIGKAILFPAAVEAIGGNLPNALTCDVWWTPWHPFKSSLAGYSANDLADTWSKETGKQWTQPLGFDYAGFEVAADALKRAGSLNKMKIREALARTDLDTMVGHIKFNKENFSLTPIVGGQWVKGKKWPWDLKIIYNEENPDIPTTGKMIFPIPR